MKDFIKKTFFLLTNIPLFNLSGLASPLDFGNKWPVYWRQFKNQPEEEYEKLYYCEIYNFN